MMFLNDRIEKSAKNYLCSCIMPVTTREIPNVEYDEWNLSFVSSSLHLPIPISIPSLENNSHLSVLLDYNVIEQSAP